MGPGRDRTRDPWICSQTRICRQTRYRLRYAAQSSSMYGLDLTRENSQFKSSKGSSSNQQGTGEVNVNTLVISSENQTTNRKRKCGCCSGTCFKLEICDHFKTMSITDRYQLVHKLKFCYNCLKVSMYLDIVGNNNNAQNLTVNKSIMVYCINGAQQRCHL